MRVRKLNDNGDIVTSGVIFLYGRESIAQTIQTRLRLFFGEYFLDTQEGTPWFQTILGKFDNLSAVESAIRLRIAETDGVVRLLSFSMDYEIVERSIVIKSNVLTKYGESEVFYNGRIDTAGIFS